MKIYMPLFCGVCALTLTGCATFDNSSAAARAQEDQLILREDLARLQGRLETLEMEYKRLLLEIDQLQGHAGGAQEQETAAQRRLNDLERRLEALDAARAQDRQLIIDQLSVKMAEMMSAGSGRPKSSAKSAAASPARTGSAAANELGYEHIVKEGETLAAIAAAYKVKVSVIIAANNLKNPDALRTGQKLFIPKAGNGQ